MRRLVIAVAGASAAGLVAMGAAIAVANTPTLRVEQGVHVDNALTGAPRVKPVNTFEAVAIGQAGHAVYTFQGETTTHLICKRSDGCWTFWPPDSVNSAGGLSKQAGIQGRLGTFHNHGMLQLTLNGHPLYYFKPDLQSSNRHLAKGDELNTFGSIWHIVKAQVAAAQGAPQSTSSSGSSGAGGYSTSSSGSSSGW